MKANGRKSSPSNEKKVGRTRREAAASLSAVQPAVNDLYLTGESERAIYNRLSRLEGQVRGVKKMLAARKSCDDMLVQISALK